MHRGLLYGWALDTQQPDARVVLEVCLNGDVFTCVMADVAHSGIRGSLKRYRQAALPILPVLPCDNCHGFVADVQAAITGGSGVLTIRIANTDLVLPGQYLIGESIKPATKITSQVYGDGGVRLHGWLVDPTDPTQAQVVRALIGNVQVAEAIANRWTPATRKQAIGAHGFVLDLPLAQADGRKHTIRVVDQHGEELGGSPLDICCHADTARSLLALHGEHGEDGETRAGLLATVLASYEQYLPRGLGMAQYRQWASRFGPPPPEERQSAVSIAFLLTGHASEAEFSRSRSSLLEQKGVVAQVYASSTGTQRVLAFQDVLQQALESGCDLVACVRAGDTLCAQASALAATGFYSLDVQLVYTDSELGGVPWFKPAWNPEYALGSDYPLELLLVRMDAIRACIAHHGIPGSADELAWSILAWCWPRGEQAIVHVPHVLYQFQSPLHADEKVSRLSAARNALKRIEPTASLVEAQASPAEAFFSARRVQRALPESVRNVPVSLVIPTRDQSGMLERCIDSVMRFTHWPNLEIIIVDNGSVQTKTKNYFRKIARQGVKILPFPGAFNFSALNNHAVDVAAGEVIGMMNNDVEVLHAGWLEEILSHLWSPGVGAVGAKLLWPDGMVQHGGVLLGMGNAAGHFGNLLADADWGDHGRNQLVQQVSAVTAACCFLRKCDYVAVGGMDERAFPVAFNDVDLCLKLRKSGKTIVWTPHARLLHAESASRGDEDSAQKRARSRRELTLLRQRWGPALLRDPAYHPSLSLDVHTQPFGGLALPPRDRSPRAAGIAGSSTSITPP